jgi:ATP adenylyltransferase
MTHLWTPWRSKYMHEKKEKSGCLFCDAGSGSADAETLVVYRGQLNFAILNRYPYTSGHLMIAPYAHVSRLMQADDATSEEMMRMARRAENILQLVYRPDGLNLGMNLGEAAGAGIEQHIHLHVLPRWNGDANFMTSIAHARVMPELLEDTYAKLKRAFLEGS